MGEPLPGDIPDPTHLKTQQVSLLNDEQASKGDWLVYSAGNASWNPPSLGSPRIVTQKQAVQLQEDIDTTGLVNAAVSAAVFSNGSWVYALVAGNVRPNSPVWLVVFDSNPSGAELLKIGFTDNFNVIVTSFAFSDPVVTLTTDDPHDLRPGDLVRITNAPTSNNNGTFLVITVPSTTTLTYQNPNGSAETAASNTTSANHAEDNGGVAKFIKRSGDTVAQEADLNEIGVFALTGLGL